MDIREQIRTAISDLPDTEKVIVLSIIMDAIIEKTRDIRQDARRMEGMSSCQGTVDSEHASLQASERSDVK